MGNLRLPIPSVCIDHSGSYKFVQIKGPEGRNYIHGNDRWGSHKGIFEYDFLRTLERYGANPSDFRCCGGGRITISASRRELIAFDASREFGKFDIEIVRSLLGVYVAENLDGYSVQVK